MSKMKMKMEFFSLRKKKSSTERQQKRRRIAPLVFAIIATIAVSQTFFSNAFVNERNTCLKRISLHSTGSPSASIFERSCQSFIFEKSENTNVVLRLKSALFASVKPSNKNRRKRKQKHLRKIERSNSASLGADKTMKSSGQSISEEELHSHLNSKINYGKNGPVGDRARIRGLIERNSDDRGDNTDYISERQRDQQFFLRQLNNRPTLVLNANYLPLGYMPLSIWSWQDAVKAIFKGSVTVVDVYPDLTVRASNIKVPLPSVIALNDYVPHKITKPSFTRRNVFLRDKYMCQYCNKRFHTADLSLDHVVPRSMGGSLSWENAVTCCKTCNGRKGSTPLSEIGYKGMKLTRKPRCPTQMELAAISGRMVPKRVHQTWKPYLGIQERPAASNDASDEKKGDEEFIDDQYFEEEAEQR